MDKVDLAHVLNAKYIYIPHLPTSQSQQRMAQSQSRDYGRVFKDSTMGMRSM
jgi:hypothetical protein